MWLYSLVCVGNPEDRFSRDAAHCLDCCFRDVNNNMMELQILAYACRTSSARNIVGVVPYLPYSKQSKMRKRGSIVCKLLAQMLSISGNLFMVFYIYLMYSNKHHGGTADHDT